MDQTGGQSPILQPNTVLPESVADGSITIPHGDQAVSVPASSSSVTPTTFDMVTPQQVLSQNQQVSPQVTATQPIPQVPFVAPETQAVASEPLQQSISSVLPLNTETPYPSPVQSNMSGFIATPQPSITEDVAQESRPDWQRQIYTDISNNQVPMAQPSMPNDIQVSEMNQLTQVSPYNTPVDIPVSPAPPIFTQPEEPFSLSYDVNTGEPVSSGGSTLTRKLLLSGIVITLIGVIGGSIYAAYTFGNNAGYKKGQAEGARLAQEATSTEENTNENETNDVDLLNFEIGPTNYVDETINGVVGEQLQSSDGLVVYVKSIERDFQPTKSLYEAESNKELLKVNILVGNADATQSKTVTNRTFSLKEPSGALLSTQTEVGDYDGQITTLQVSPGGKIRMSLVFSVEKGATPLVLVRQQSYSIRSSGTIVSMSMEVDLEV